VLERAVVLADGPAITIDDLPPELRKTGRRGLRPRLPTPVGVSGSILTAGDQGAFSSSFPARSRATADGRDSDEWPASGSKVASVEAWDAEYVSYERQRLIDALNEAQGNKSVAARLLDMPRSTFFSKLKKHGIA
ncbi:MAG: helix-turn-helix domain-containing protein, partial [Isosphaeraceae bacterium]